MDDFNVGGWRGDFFGLNAPEELLTDDFLRRLSALNKDASWVSQPRWDAVMPGRANCFPLLCPDFAAELLPAPHERDEIEGKMREYIASGARLGWLIDPRRKRVEVYRPGRPVEVLSDPSTASGEDVLPGFTLDLTRVWT